MKRFEIVNTLDTNYYMPTTFVIVEADEYGLDYSKVIFYKRITFVGKSPKDGFSTREQIALLYLAPGQMVRELPDATLAT